MATSVTQIKVNQRVTFIGKTGSGKTYLARALLLQADRLVVIDGKGLLDPDEWQAELIEPDELIGRLGSGGDWFRLIVRPTSDEIDPIGEILATQSNVIVYVDELYWLYPGTRIIPGWSSLWTRGREQSIGVWAGVQRPTSIPLIALSEAEHFFVFRLTMPEDRDRVAKVIGRSSLPRLPRLSFLYAHPEADQYVLYDRVKLVKTEKRGYNPVQIEQSDIETKGGSSNA